MVAGTSTMRTTVASMKIADAGVGSPEHNVLARRFQIVVDYLERAWPVPSTDCLRVEAHTMNRRYMGVDDCRRSAVERDAAAHITGRIAVNVTSIDDQVAGHQRDAALAAIAK